MIPEVEWSGILLYEVQGTITQPQNMKIIAKDIIPMHKGSKVFTSYSYNEPKRDSSGFDDKHIDYCEENSEAIMYKVGHIHSHNNMDVFFSNTDMEELNDNCVGHNFYLSLIVNNRMDLQAKVAIFAESEVENSFSFKSLDQNGKEFQIFTEEKVKTIRKKMLTYNCEIEADFKSMKPFDFFTRSLADIMSKSEVTPYFQKRFFPPKDYLPAIQSKETTPEEGWEEDDNYEILIESAREFLLYFLGSKSKSEEKAIVQSLNEPKNFVNLFRLEYDKAYTEYFSEEADGDQYEMITVEIIEIMYGLKEEYPTLNKVINILEAKVL